MKRRRVWPAAALLLLVTAVGARAQGGEDRVGVEELKQLVARNSVVVLDVRNEEIERKIRGALHMPYNDIERRAAELPRDREIVTYCA